MSQITKEIVVDVAKKNSLKTIFAKQNDSNSRFLKATLLNEGEIIKVPETAQAVLNVCRADGSAKAFFGTVNPNGTVTVPLTSWALGIDDIVTCSISIIGEDGEKLTSTSFSVSVETAEYTGEDISEDENGDILTQLLSAAVAANTAAEKASNAVLEAGEAVKAVARWENVTVTVEMLSENAEPIVTLNDTKDGKIILFSLPRGHNGDTGESGYSPVLGVDYFTPADKKEIVDQVLAALPNGEEMSF